MGLVDRGGWRGETRAGGFETAFLVLFRIFFSEAQRYWALITVLGDVAVGCMQRERGTETGPTGGRRGGDRCLGFSRKSQQHRNRK